MAQVVNLGGGIGPAFTAALEGYKSGTEFHEAREREERAAAIDEENLRGAKYRNNNTRDQGLEDRQMFPGELEQQGLNTENMRGDNTLQDYDIKQAEREESTKASADHLRADAEKAEVRAMTATAKNTIAGQSQQAAENWRIAQRDRVAAADRDETSELLAQATAAEQRLASRQAARNDTSDEKLGGRQADADAVARDSVIMGTAFQAILDRDPTGGTLVAHLNGSENYDLTAEAAMAKVDENGVLRILDRNGNPVMNKLDVDGDGKPDTMEMDLSALTPEVVNRYLPGNAALLGAKKSSTTKSGTTRFANDLNKNVWASLNNRYGRVTPGTLGQDDTVKPPTESMQVEHREILKNIGKRMKAEGLTEEQAYAVEMDHPDLMNKARALTGMSSETLEAHIRLERDKYADNKEVITRLQILKVLIAQATKEQQASGGSGDE